MKELSDGSVFLQVVKKSNVMTPRIIGYYKIPNGEVEVSTGSFMNRTIFGVTTVKNGEIRDDLSKCFRFLEDALMYVDYLSE